MVADASSNLVTSIIEKNHVKKSKPKFRELIEITWRDIISSPSWLEEGFDEKAERINENAEHQSVGYFLQNSKNFITISQTIAKNQDIKRVGEAISIPIGCIISIKKL